MSKQSEHERKQAIDQHATYGSGPKQDVPFDKQLASLRAALNINLSKPVHKQSGTVIADLRRRIRDVEKNITATA